MIFILDFDDSFTYNIYSELKLACKSEPIQVVSKENCLNVLSTLTETDRKTLIILGPGPGHPHQYNYLHPTLKKLMSNENVFILGICLGHQILGEILGHKISHCHEPMHGRAIELELDKTWQKHLGLKEKITVQRYNSLAVISDSTTDENLIAALKKNSEVLIFAGTRLISYQFHPESVGTKYRDEFFRKPLAFLI